MKPTVSIVAAIARHSRVVGRQNKLLWHIPEDLKRFRDITMGHPVILGSKTYESILGYLGKPLPGRTNIVLTRNPSYPVPEGVLVSTSLEDALRKAAEIDQDEIFIGGGPNVWTQSLPFVDKLYLTLVDDEPEGDAFFPDYSAFTKVVSEEKSSHEGLTYTWLTLEK